MKILIIMTTLFLTIGCKKVDSESEDKKSLSSDSDIEILHESEIYGSYTSDCSPGADSSIRHGSGQIIKLELGESSTWVTEIYESGDCLPANLVLIVTHNIEYNYSSSTDAETGVWYYSDFTFLDTKVTSTHSAYDGYDICGPSLEKDIEFDITDEDCPFSRQGVTQTFRVTPDEFGLYQQIPIWDREKQKFVFTIN